MAFACDEVAGFECKRVPAHDAVAVLASERSLHTRHALVRNPLHEADVELDLVPLYDLGRVKLCCKQGVEAQLHMCAIYCHCDLQNYRFAACSAAVAHLRLLGWLFSRSRSLWSMVFPGPG